MKGTRLSKYSVLITNMKWRAMMKHTRRGY